MEKLSNADIKWIKSLQEKQTRKTTQCYIIEGEKMLTEVLASAAVILLKVVTTMEGVEHQFKLTDVPVFRCSPAEMERISALKSPTPILAVLRITTSTPSLTGKVLCLDNIQDPGNLGTIIRIADWFGIEQIVASEHTVDAYNPKTVQASMGSIFRVNIHYTDINAFLASCALPIYGAMMDGESMATLNMEQPAVLVIGNEGNGISKPVIEHLTHRISIPRIGKAESLNAAVATGILVSAWNRF